MTLEDWDKDNHLLKKEATSKQEIAGLLRKVDMNLKQAGNGDIDEDWRFAIAFAAILQCATIPLRAEGYRLKTDPRHHENTIYSLKHTIKADQEFINKIQSFRGKRSKIMYDYSGTASDTEVAQLLKYAKQLRDDVVEWLKKKHPEYLKPAK